MALMNILLCEFCVWHSIHRVFLVCLSVFIFGLSDFFLLRIHPNSDRFDWKID